MEKTIEIPEGYEARIEGNKVIFERKESEDERLRRLLVWQVHRNIEDETNDLAGSVYDGIKGHDPDLEESIEDWKKCLAYLEKQKEVQSGDEDRYMEGYMNGMNDALKGAEPAEWSEEDKKMIDDIIYCLPRMAMGNIEMLPSVAEQYAQRLKSLRDNYKKCNSRWKPSEEQIDAMKYTLGNESFYKLKAEIKKIRQAMIDKGAQKDLCDAELIRRSTISTCNNLLNFAASLQQEQQGVDFETEGIITNAGGQFGYDVATFRLYDNHAFTVLIPHDDNAKHGDKVKLIVIKEK